MFLRLTGWCAPKPPLPVNGTSPTVNLPNRYEQMFGKLVLDEAGKQLKKSAKKWLEKSNRIYLRKC